MAEVLLLPLMSGSLGVVALLYYQWWRWQQQLAQQCNDDVSRQIRPVSSLPKVDGMGIQNPAIAPQPIS